jgi:hypothetical protein
MHIKDNICLPAKPEQENYIRKLKGDRKKPSTFDRVITILCENDGSFKTIWHQ